MIKINTAEMREQCAGQLLAAQERVGRIKTFVGLDGFVDEIVHVVDKRESAEQYQRLAKISQFADRLAAAAGRSTNIELVGQMVKLGGNGPIMANALAGFGLQVTYLGLLGYPSLHPVFGEFARRAETHSIGDPGRTDALEFEDGKIMQNKQESLKEMNWANICTRFGREKFTAKIADAQLIGFVNWTMLARMNEIWEAVLAEICPLLQGPRRLLFIDLADPEKRTPADLHRALELVVGFEKYFDVILGLNEKESGEIGKVLGLAPADGTPEGLAGLARKIHKLVPVGTLVIHPTSYALAVNRDRVSIVAGPFTPKPRITTGAGDHFNSGFCLGKLLGLDDAASLLTGVATSGYYVRTVASPTLPDLARLLHDWPV
jgi:sugar/nucleoside kinase (ribokinase family)